MSDQEMENVPEEPITLSDNLEVSTKGEGVDHPMDSGVADVPRSIEPSPQTLEAVDEISGEPTEDDVPTLDIQEEQALTGTLPFHSSIRIHKQ